MAQLIEVWDEVHTMLAGYSAQQIHQLQAILFSVLGKYDISRKEETTDLVEYYDGVPQRTARVQVESVDLRPVRSWTEPEHIELI